MGRRNRPRLGGTSRSTGAALLGAARHVVGAFRLGEGSDLAADRLLGEAALGGAPLRAFVHFVGIPHPAPLEDDVPLGAGVAHFGCVPRPTPRTFPPAPKHLRTFVR